MIGLREGQDYGTMIKVSVSSGKGPIYSVNTKVEDNSGKNRIENGECDEGIIDILQLQVGSTDRNGLLWIELALVWRKPWQGLQHWIKTEF